MGSNNVESVVNARNADAEVLQYFWELASVDQVARVTAANGLVTALLASQAQHMQQGAAVPSVASEDDDDTFGGEGEGGGGGGEDDEDARQARLMRQALASCSPLVQYCVRRLVRGLSSGRQGARQGFAAALAALLAPHAELGKGGGREGRLMGAPAALALVTSSLPVTRSMSGTEQRDALMGRIFGVAALVRSGLLSSDADAALAAAEALSAAGAARSFLREAAAATLLELLQASPPEVTRRVLGDAPGVRALVTALPADATPEGLWLALRLWHLLPPAVLEECRVLPRGTPPPPPKWWASPDAVPRAKAAPAGAALLSRHHCAALAPALLASSASHPRLHGVWGCVLALLLPGFRAVKKDAAAAGPGGRRPPPDALQLEALWGVVVEGGLFAGGSHERKALGFSLLQLLLPHLTPELVPVVFTPNLLRTLVNALKDRSTYLHASAKRVAERIAALGERGKAAAGDAADAGGGDGNALALAMAAALQSVGGAAGFDATTRTKTVAGLFSGLDAAGVDAYVSQLLASFQAATATPAAADTQRSGAEDREEEEEEEEEEGGGGGARGAGGEARARWAAEQLAATARLPAARREAVERVARFLAAQALLQAAPAAAPTPGASARKGKKGAAAVKGGGAGDAPEVAALRRAAAPASPELRQLCAARLMGLLSAPGLAATATPAPAAPAAAAADDGAAAGDVAHPPKKRAKVDVAAAAAARRDAASEGRAALLAAVLGFVGSSLSAPGVRLALELPDAVGEAVGQLEAAEQLLGRLEGPRARALLHLAQLMRLHYLADPLGLDPTAAGDLARVAAEGLAGAGLAAPASTGAGGAAAAAPMQTDSEEEEGSAEGEGDEAPAAWADVLLDVLLALLAQPPGTLPSAPLREAAEAAFRACAEELTPTGLGDLLRVLSQRPQEGESVLADAEEGEGSDEEDAEGPAGEEEEEGSDSGSESDDGDASDAAPGRAPGGAAVDDGAGSGGDAAEAGEAEGDGEGSDLDDEAMMRLDAKLGSYLRAARGARGGGSARERAAALLALQMRAAALLEYWIKRLPKSPLVLQAAAPLLRAAASAARPSGNPALAERLLGLAGKQLGRSRPELEGVGAEEVAAVLRRVLYVASRERDARVAGAAASVLLTLLTAAAAAGDDARAAAGACAAAALSDFLTKKKSRLGRRTLEDLMSRCPAAALQDAPLAVLLTGCATPRSEYQRGEAAALLAAAFCAQPAAQRELLAPALAAHKPALAAALSAAALGPHSGRDRHVGALKAVTTVLEGARKLAEGGKLARLVGPDALAALAKAVATLRALGVAPKVDAQLGRMVERGALAPLVAKATPDPARLAAMRKARALQEEAANGAAASAAAPPANPAPPPPAQKKTKGPAGDSGARQKKRKL